MSSYDGIISPSIALYIDGLFGLDEIFERKFISIFRRNQLLVRSKHVFKNLLSKIPSRKKPSADLLYEIMFYIFKNDYHLSYLR